MKKVFLLFCVGLLSIISACQSYPTDVEQALKLAGHNKEELIKVLEYYKGKDELKYQAACFLISNMPYHKSKVHIELSPAYFNYFRTIDSICNVDAGAIKNDSLKRHFGRSFDSIPAPAESQSKSDIELLSADYIIENIELAFEEWKNSPLLKKISFNEFKEWILPYRTVDESLVNSRRLLRTIIHDRLTKNGIEDIRKPIACYQKYATMQKAMNTYISSRHHVGIFDPFIPAFKMDCHNLAAHTCNYFRACGIPVVYEFTSQWPDKDSKHYWCASPDSSNVLQPYTPPYNNLKEDWESSLKYVGKVYQKTFGAMKDSPYFLKNNNEIVPKHFDIATIRDVSERYHVCQRLTIPMKGDLKNNLAYLSFFNTQGSFTPVAWGKIDKSRKLVTFEKVPVNLLFFPTSISSDGKVRCFDAPFILRYDRTAGTIMRETMKANVERKISMHLLRKYPSKKHLAECRKTLQGATLLAADNWNGPYDTLLVIKDVPGPYWQEYCSNNSKKRRYYRFAPRDKLPMDIAEFEFLGKKESKHTYSVPTELPVFSQKEVNCVLNNYMKIEGIPMKTGPLYANFFDGNPETYTRWGYLGMDFQTPVCVDRIRILPRTALNIIEPKQQYQLLYFRNGQWVEHKMIVSEYNFLDVDSVPEGTVYWLRNLDKGREELPFYYKNGKQIFINEYMQ